MNCSHCNKNAATVYFSYSGNLCRKCFLRLIEARVRKYARLQNVFKKDDRILVIDKLSTFLIRRIVGDLPFKMFNKKYKISQLKTPLVNTFIKKKRINKIIIPWTIDDECCMFLEHLFVGKTTKLKYYSLMLTMTDEEALLFAGYNTISFKPLKKNKEIQAIMRTLEEKYPETKFSLVKSVKEMRKILGS